MFNIGTNIGPLEQLVANLRNEVLNTIQNSNDPGTKNRYRGILSAFDFLTTRTREMEETLCKKQKEFDDANLRYIFVSQEAIKGTEDAKAEIENLKRQLAEAKALNADLISKNQPIR